MVLVRDDLAGRPGPFLLVQLPITLIAGSIGVWLFYVQHQFEGTLWARDEGWNFHEAALNGSSHYDLPNVLRWFTANIGVHHVHHLCSRIPYYRLPRVLRDHPELDAIRRLTLLQSLLCVRLRCASNRFSCRPRTNGSLPNVQGLSRRPKEVFRS